MHVRKGRFQPNIYRILLNVNQVIYTLDTIRCVRYHDPSSSGSPDVDKIALLYGMPKSKKGDN